MADSSESLLQSEDTASSRVSALLGRASRQNHGSLRVRRTAAAQIAERRADWGFSKPVVALDISWNLTFAVASLGILSSTFLERPCVPIRIWIFGYAVQCFLHVFLVWAEYQRRSRTRREGQGIDEIEEGTSQEFRFAKSCESINTIFALGWWILGFYWVVVAGGNALLQDAPTLYWLTVILLGFDVLFAVLCVVLACIIGVTLCCCLPFIIAILYTVAGQVGATDADISMLPLYKFVLKEKDIEVEGTMVPLGEDECERRILIEDAVCCICITTYEEGVELRSLPCDHHFHATCIGKWLSIKATCPLCNYDIIKGTD
ncbi:E3 ubiquitin protein ligase RIE1-like [Wolffia australiana]